MVPPAHAFGMLRLALRFLLPAKAAIPSLEFHTSTHLTRWYKNSLRLKGAHKLAPKPIIFPDDCEQQHYEAPTPEIIHPLVAQMPDVQCLEEPLKRLFSYRFVFKKEELSDYINAKLTELGYHPADTSLGANVIRMTMRIRFKKYMLQKHPKNTQLFFGTRALINARIYSLRLLRATNMNEFVRLTKALNITGFRFPDPFKHPDHDPVTAERKRAVRTECYHLRLEKLANLKVRMASSEDDFYKRKEQVLNKLLTDLESVSEASQESPPRHRAEVLLQQLFDQVVAERKAEVLKETDRDELAWFDKEAVQRAQYMEKMAQKAQKQLKKKR